jgi:hypothetical protein
VGNFRRPAGRRRLARARQPWGPARSGHWRPDLLPVALTYHAGLLVFAGEFAAATALLDEANAIAAATSNAQSVCVCPLLAAMRGDEALARGVIEACV